MSSPRAGGHATRLAALCVALSVGCVLPLPHPGLAQTGWLDRQALTGEWNGSRPFLSDHGFAPYLDYTGTMASLLAGGAEAGTEFTGYLDCGFDLDLGKLGMPDGAGFHADFHWFQGRSPTTTLVGGTLAMSVNEWEASNAPRIFNLYFRQTWESGPTTIEVGQIAADTSFMISRYAGILLNGAFGDLPNENLATNVPVYPLAAPGAFLETRPLEVVTWRAAAFTADAGRDVSGNHGFGWTVGNDAGYGFFSELALDAEPAGRTGTYTLGGYYVAGEFPILGTDDTAYGNYGLYAMVDQTLVLGREGRTALGAFARLSASPQQDRNPAFLYADAGLNWFAPWPGRSDDVLGFGFGILRPSDHADGLDATSAALPHGQAVVELTYQAAVYPWLKVQPDVQVVLDPITSGRDSLVVGVQAVAVF